MLVIIVVGSRSFNDRSLMYNKLDYYLQNQDKVLIVHGGANMGIDVTYQGKRITAQDTFVMHCSEENIRYAEEQVKMFEEVYNKVKEIYSDGG